MSCCNCNILRPIKIESGHMYVERAFFHRFVDRIYEGQLPQAIVEFENGFVTYVDANSITFLDSELGSDD